MTPRATIIRYESNNSGGFWWIEAAGWKALEAAGWKVAWFPEPSLGALATSATRSGLSYKAAIKEWEKVTGNKARDQGCVCCGPPHAFYIDDDEDEDEDEGTP